MPTQTSRRTNPWEAKNRLLKADKLVAHLDAYFIDLEVADPSRDGAAIAEGLRAWTPKQWAEFAVGVGSHPPSDITIGIICDRYQQRAKAVAEGRIPCALCTDASCHLCAGDLADLDEPSGVRASEEVGS